MGPTVADLVAEIIDRIEDRPVGPGRPPMSTAEVVETLRFFLREGVDLDNATVSNVLGFLCRCR
jgi:hypothetical protein